jgi:hypothetical protein
MQGGTRSNSWKRADGTTVRKTEREYLCSTYRTKLDTGAPPSCPGFGVVQKTMKTTRVKANRIEAMVGLWMVETIGDPERLQTYGAEADRRLLALASEATVADLEAKRAKIELQRLAVLEEYRSELYGEIGSDKAKHIRDANLARYDADLEAVNAELERIGNVEQERERIALTIADLLAMPIDSEGRDPQADEEPPRGSEQWAAELQAACLTALTPGKRGVSPALPPGVVAELHALARDLGVTVVVSRNDGDGPRLIDHEGETIVGLAERLGDQEPARWPDVTVGFDPNLSRRSRSEASSAR